MRWLGVAVQRSVTAVTNSTRLRVDVDILRDPFSLNASETIARLTVCHWRGSINWHLYAGSLKQTHGVHAGGGYA